MAGLNKHRTFIYKTADLVTFVHNRRRRFEPKSQCFPKPNRVDLVFKPNQIHLAPKPNQVVLMAKPNQVVLVTKPSHLGVCVLKTPTVLCTKNG